MPRVDVCLWNIRDYGSGTSQRRWGADSDLRNRFIRIFVRRQEIDVLLVMEPFVSSEASLRDLTLWLNGDLDDANADWCVSLCGSALAARATPNPPTGEGDLIFKTDGRSEGYAVAWRDRRTRYRVLPGLHPIAPAPVASRRNTAPPARTPLNLVTRGRPAGRYEVTVPASGRRKEHQVTMIGALGGYRPTSVFPYDVDGALMDHWPPLAFPTTGGGNPNQFKMHRTRRPAYVVLDLANGGTARQRLCPAAAYHAPSAAEKAADGTLMAGLSRELYVTNDVAGGVPGADTLVHCENTILGGDFNHSVDAAAWPDAYGAFVDPFRAGQTGGAAAAAAPPPTDPAPDRRTTVQLLRGDHSTIIDSDDLDDYLRFKFDLVFTRGEMEGERVNVPQLLLDDDDGDFAFMLKALHTHLTGVVAGLAGPLQRMAPGGTGPQEYRQEQDAHRRWVWGWHPMICGSWGGTFVDWDEFMDQLKNGRFTEARQVAEFYHIFVSDHLPLVATIDW
jgi:hypothetical protein